MQATQSIKSIILYDKQGNVDGELSLDEIRESVDKRRHAVNLIFKYVTEQNIRDAHRALNDAASWQVRMELLLNRRNFNDDEKQLLLQILHVAAGDELERSLKNNGVQYEETPYEPNNASTTELIDLIIRGQSMHA